jgi:hypothetical protein
VHDANVQRAGPGVLGTKGDRRCGVAETLVEALSTSGERSCDVVMMCDGRVAVQGEKMVVCCCDDGGLVKEVTIRGEPTRRILWVLRR